MNISTEELAQACEESAEIANIEGFAELAALVIEAAARLRALAEDAERLGLPQSGFYVQDTRDYVGNDMLFWRKEAKGYTTDLRDAMVFTRAELAGLRDTDQSWPVAYINARWRPAVDFQKTDSTHPDAAIDKARHD